VGSGWARSVAAAIAVAWLAASPGTAQARWLKADTDRFVVYSDGEEAELRGFAAKLTKFDQMLRLMHRVEDRDLGRKLDVYLIRQRGQLYRILPRAPREFAGLLGFFRAEPEAIHAVAIRDHLDFRAETVLFHEYTHHFMLEYFPAGYPGWLVEGYAEYFSTVQVTPEFIEIGRYNDLRAATLTRIPWMPLDQLMRSPSWQVSGRQREAYYGQSWLLTHYMMIDEARARQLDTATRAIAAGAPPVAAMEAATGMKVGDLSDTLHRYVKTKLLYRRIKNPFPMETPMTVTVLPPSADDILLESLSLSGPMLNNDGRDLVGTLRRRAKAYPGDALAELTLARAEIRFGDREAAEAILQRRLAADPKEVESLRLMGESRLAAGRADRDQRERYFKEARPFLARAYAVNNSDYQTLYAYARARSIDTGYPDENTLNALLLAHQLAPSVPEIRLSAGEALLKRGKTEEAVAVLTPLANSHHGGAEQKQAAVVIAKIKGLAPPENESGTAASDGASRP